MSKKITSSYIGYRRAADTDLFNQSNHSHVVIGFTANGGHLTRWTPGYCKICRAGYEVITCDHAQKHGFKTPEEMAKSDIVKPLGRGRM